jgi:LysR family hydrogen peroxide-inducible transcriptional activator
MDLTPVTLTELRYVVAVADTGHFGQAASRCHVSQPTLSAQIKKLEETLGVQVTAIGAEVVGHARAMLDQLRRIGDLARGQHESLAGPLRLGVIPTLAPYLLPWLVPPLQKGYPRLPLVLREGLTATLPALAVRDRGGPKGIVTKPFQSPAPCRRIGLAWRRSYPGVAVEAG